MLLIVKEKTCQKFLEDKIFYAKPSKFCFAAKKLIGKHYSLRILFDLEKITDFFVGEAQTKKKSTFFRIQLKQ